MFKFLSKNINTIYKLRFCFYIVINFVIITLAACKDNESERDIIKMNLTTFFPKEITVSAKEVSFPAIIDIADLFVSGDELVCFSDLDTFAVHRFDLEGFSFKDKSGRRGEGPDEFLEPAVIKTHSPHFDIVDAYKFKILTENDTVEFKNDLPNELAMLDDSKIGYYTLDAGDRCMKILDLNKKVVCDSIFLNDISPDLKMKSFFWSSNGDKMVMSFINVNMLVILDVKSGLKKGLQLKGSELQPGQIAFLTVECMDDAFYVLNISNVDMKNGTGESEIWKFDYEGNPLMKIKTGIIATRMCYNNHDKQFILKGQEDDVLYLVDITD